MSMENKILIDSHAGSVYNNKKHIVCGSERIKGKRVRSSYGRATVKEEYSSDATGKLGRRGDTKIPESGYRHTVFAHGYERWPGVIPMCCKKGYLTCLVSGQVFLY